MGNSGSMNGLSGYEEGYHHHPGYHHHHQRYHDAMRGEPGSGMSSSWMDSYQRDHHRRGAGPRDHDQQQQIKVLPDIPGKVAKLRSTNNGSILHAGGTISKNNQALQRSKSISSPTYQQHHQQQQQPASFSECDEDLELSSLQPRMLMQRSRTQLNLMPPGGVSGGGRTRNGHSYAHDEDGRAGPPDRGGRQAATRYGEPSGAGNVAESLNHRKRFGSEPDLRLSLLPRNGQQSEQASGGPRNPKMAQSKIMKGKNKKKAPVPPVMEKRDANKDTERQRIIAYSPMRKPGSDANTSTLPSSSDGSFNVAATRKLRLFKTRAETKKTPTIAKLPEASDAKFPGKHGPSTGGGFLRSAVPLQPTGSAPHTILGHSAHRNDSASPDDEKLATALDHISPRPNPTSFFRREKTFDAGLLGLERQREIEPRPATKPTMSPPLSRRKSIVKSFLEQDTPVKPTTTTTTVGSNRMDSKSRQQVGTPAESYQRKLALAEAQRKQSSAATSAAAITDFQKELQLATRRKTGNTDTPASPTVNRAGAGQTKPTRAGVGTERTSARFSLLPTGGGKPKQTGSSNALVINVEPAKESDHSAGTKSDPKQQDARDSPPPPTPPPPPPPPKTSFYFGMRGDDRQLPSADAPRRFSTTKRTAPAAAESRTEDSGSERQDIDGQSVEEIGHTQMELIDQFAASLLNSSRFRSSDSVASSEADVRTGPVSSWDEPDGPGQQEIALKLRPTLPRKQFDIPRFSPAAAWRLLTTEDEFCRDAPIDVVGGTGVGGEKKSFLRGLDQDVLDAVPEDRIQRVYREPVPGLQDNKSGDSGISGDAGILADIGPDALMASSGKEERAGDTTPESGTQLHKGGGGAGGTGVNGGWSSNALLLMPWTPQQDLDDDEDEDDEDEEEDHEDDATTGSGSEPRRHLLDDRVGSRVNGDTRPDFSSKGHLFSLSLPRENHLSIYNVEATDEKVEKHVFNSLQKFRKSVSGAFKTEDSGGQMDSNDSNWFLGRLDTKLSGTGTGPGSGSEKRSKLMLLPDGREREGTDTTGTAVSIGAIAQSKHSSIGYLVSGKHMMYLPKEPTKLHSHTADKSSKQDENNNRKSYHNQNGSERQDKSAVPASEVSAALQRDPTHRSANGDKENLQDPVPVAAAGVTHTANGEFENFPVKLTNRRNHRFTFQSTIRQIEKRRVAEKLSREAEIKEAMRLSELEAMRRVEEEFQKKRAREKASIRHQLRLFSMENHPDQHQASNEGDVEQQDSTGETKRSDPDGDSLPHQSALGRSGLYRKKEFTGRGSMERQYKRPNGVAATGTNHASAPTGDDDMELEDEMEMEKVTGRGGRRRYGDEDDDDDDDGESSSLGYVDTRTPYISRIIQAKSSKSYAMKK
ncbi:uncharacterized protein LOC118504399 [Anopheles stephensi]|uniref:Uncharacterized protein n=1 Tax=Anopheles stephensi TaxID=30069 RepID=A0A182YH78_ANOST|nr:uncharacterized protein LOC118504399 [Anopheles stephensi]XP_035894717.1 uncharacterized protein LOC118504399 [Anopheles stephensi]XP_035894724.1 uncharacterized protein LOC118504399 [Anopheles stephensi]